MKKVLYLSLPLVVLSSCTGETAASDFSDVQEALEKTINLNYGDTRFDLMIIKNEGKENETTNYAYYEIKNNYEFSYGEDDNVTYINYGKSLDNKAFYTISSNDGLYTKKYIKETDANEDYQAVQNYFVSLLPAIKTNLNDVGLSVNKGEYKGNLKVLNYDFSFTMTIDEEGGLKYINYLLLNDKKTGDSYTYTIFGLNEEFLMPYEAVTSSLTNEAFDYTLSRVLGMDNFTLGTEIDGNWTETFTRIGNTYRCYSNEETIDFKFIEEGEETKWYLLNQETKEWMESSLAVVGMYMDNFSIFTTAFESFKWILHEFSFSEENNAFYKDDDSAYFYIFNDYVERLKTTIDEKVYRFEVSNIGLHGEFIYE
ncbi:MAG: hypothetical protein IJ247_06615 [Bacilli bacterium]|nr:hypothetical protein [Bacilli bacterium]